MAVAPASSRPIRCVAAQRCTLVPVGFGAPCEDGRETAIRRRSPASEHTTYTWHSACTYNVHLAHNGRCGRSPAKLGLEHQKDRELAPQASYIDLGALLTRDAVTAAE